MRASDKYIGVIEWTPEYVEVKLYGGADRFLIDGDVVSLLDTLGRRMTRYTLFDVSGTEVSDFRIAKTAIVWHEAQ